MSQQYSGGSADESGRPPTSGATPNPFSREAAGDGAGLGSDGPAPGREDVTEPDGIVGAPGGPSAYPSPDPYTGPGTYSSTQSTSSDPGYSSSAGYGSGPTQPYPSSQPYSPNSAYPSSSSSSAPDAPYASPAGAGTPADPYSVPSASDPAPTPPAYGASYGQSSGYPPNPYDTGGYQYGTAHPYGYVPQQHPRGTTALVLGILGLVLCPIVGIVGFSISSRARKEIQAEPQRYSNGGMITAGWVLGIISIVYASFWAIYLVFIVIAIIASEA
ncbi:hypothetical protein [Microlunatus parietis]|uniref:DUF4190 domain-containing protein n=1 Tax=Microlunatus parietis TaxID=682979 RepID=A0A7Y9IBL8_9ACTN|nr:hypothetical protein [Microlunatus parietis]NYE73702.1 hypothetical protein [Microlunatus parietis]